MRAANDTRVLLVARGLRLFAYGFLSVVLALYLAGAGLSGAQIGVVFTAALAGGAVTTAGLSLVADRLGRRRSLILCAVLMAGSGVIYAVGGGFWLLLAVAAIGTISPSGYDVGPFQSLEQAALAETEGSIRVTTYAWYSLIGSLALALGGLVVGVIPRFGGLVRAAGSAERVLVWAFVAAGALLIGVYMLLTDRVEPRQAPRPRRTVAGLGESRGPVLRLSALFGVDALAGGLVIQSFVAYWFTQRFGVGLEQLGPLFFGTNLLSAVSFLIAARLAARFGLLKTMVFTHLPSNLLLIAVAFMPTWPLAALALLLRHALSQMDVPTRQAYTMMLVAPQERSAAAGVTNAVRTAAAAVSPVISGIAFEIARLGLPFVLSGGLKSAYDIALWLTFRRVPLREEARASALGGRR